MNDTEIPAILSPSEMVDQVWHAHLLRPKLYAQFCQVAFGKIIDHDLPGSKSFKDEKAKRKERTRNLYKVVFKQEANCVIWMEEFERPIFIKYGYC